MSENTPDLSIPDLTGVRAVVTGASDGMGVGIAARLAGAGAEVILPVRNQRKGEVALAKITTRSGSKRVSLRDLDLSSLSSVTALCDTLGEEGVPVGILINNAGVMTPPSRRLTQDGFELQFGTNFLGAFALVMGLLPLLRSGHAHVTSQVSVAAASGSIKWDDLEWEHGYGDGMAAYRQSKIALGLFGLELDRRSRELRWGITSNLSHPGIAPTSLLAARPELGRDHAARGRGLIGVLSRLGLVGTVESAGLPAVMAATSPDAQGGALYGPRGLGHLGGAPARQPLFKPLQDAVSAARIWETAQELEGRRQ
ncbi:MAG: SDR family oxidoreductase [Pseudoclavibacter sp.]